MKRIVPGVLLVLCVAAAFVPAKALQSDGSVDLFYSALSPYGEWIVVSDGVYAWRPLGVDPVWQPYTVGRWIWSDHGWYWWSAEPWAWAVYHYGRWYEDEHYGWIWIPGFDWAPAWVEWRSNDDYVGWAPLGPYAVFSVSFGIHYNRFWATPARWWVFMPCGSLTHPEPWRHAYPGRNHVHLVTATRPIGSVRFTAGRIVVPGPERAFVERRGNLRLEQATIADVGAREAVDLRDIGGRAQIQAYRPNIQRGNTSTDPYRPRRLTVPESGNSLDMRGMDYRPGEDARSIRSTPRVYEQIPRQEGAKGSREDISRPSRNGSAVPHSTGSRYESKAPPAKREPSSQPPAPRANPRERKTGGK